MANKHTVTLDDYTVWPRPRIEDLEWTLRYGTAADLERVRYTAAMVVDAYAALIEATDDRRRKVVSQIKRASREASSPKIHRDPNAADSYDIGD